MSAVRGRVARLRRARALRVEVMRLVAAGDVAVLSPLLGMDASEPAVREIVRDVVTGLLSDYRTMRSPIAGRVLLHHPLALLEIPETHEAYLGRVGPKTRNVLRKASRSGYEFREFDWNGHLGEIYEVNTSAAVRRGRPMEGWYAEPVQPREESELKRYHGAFKDDRLVGYLHLVVCGNFGLVRHFLGHAGHLTGGIMNGLISAGVERYAGDPRVKWLKYGPLVAGEDSLDAFKRHAGFRQYATFVDLEGDPELGELGQRQEVRPWSGL